MTDHLQQEKFLDTNFRIYNFADGSLDKSAFFGFRLNKYKWPLLIYCYEVFGLKFPLACRKNTDKVMGTDSLKR